MSPTTTATEAQVAQSRQLVLAQDATRAALTAQMVAMASQSVRDFNGWYDTEQIAAWTARLARQMETLQRTLARSTDAYLARFSSQVTGKRVRPVGAVDVATLRQGITHEGAYGRAADVYRYQQHVLDRVATEVTRNPTVEPPKFETPVDAALARVQAVADVDAQLVVREQARQFLSEQRDAIGWRRVIHPERSKGGTCGLCAAASARLYKVAELMPIHNRCECVPTPVYDRADVAAELNRIDLGQLYEDAGNTTDAASLKRTRYAVTEHGELGPVLHAFDKPLRTRADVRRDKSETPRRAKTPVEQHRSLEQVLQGQESALPIIQELAADAPDKWRDYESQLRGRIDDLRRQLAA